MKSVAIGFGLSLAYAIGAFALMATGSLLGLESPWWPIHWPAFLFMVGGIPFFFVVDTIPAVTQVMYVFVPDGGAPGVFAGLVGTAFLIWGCALSIAAHFWPRKGKLHSDSN